MASVHSHIALDDGDGLARVHLRLWQLLWTAITILATVWCMTLGYVPGVIAVVTAKHVLVAILLMGLRVNAPRETE